MNNNDYENSNVIQCLREFSDYEFQKRAWVLGIGPDESSFVELTCQLFDDTGLGRALEKNQIIFDTETDEIIRQLHKMIHKVDKRMPPDKLIDSDQMRLIRELARKALNQIQEV